MSGKMKVFKSFKQAELTRRNRLRSRFSENKKINKGPKKTAAPVRRGTADLKAWRIDSL